MSWYTSHTDNLTSCMPHDNRSNFTQDRHHLTNPSFFLICTCPAATCNIAHTSIKRPLPPSTPNQFHTLKIQTLTSPTPPTMSDTNSSQNPRHQEEQTMQGIQQELSRLQRNKERADARNRVVAASSAQQASSARNTDKGTGQGAAEKDAEEARKKDTDAGAQAGAAAGGPSEESEKGPLRKSQSP